MKCKPDRLIAYVLGELERDQAVRLEEHLARCKRCSQRLTQLRQTLDLVAALPEADGRPVEMERLREAIEAKRVSHAPFRSPLKWELRTRITNALARRRALALVAAFVVAILCFRYGFAVRVGQFEIALGPSRLGAAPIEQQAQIDERLIRTIASREIQSQVVPAIAGLARYAEQINQRYGAAIEQVRIEFAMQRAADRTEMVRNLKLIAGAVDHALSQGR